METWVVTLYLTSMPLYLIKISYCYVFVMDTLPIKICRGLNQIHIFCKYPSMYFIAYLDSVSDSSFYNLWNIPLGHLQSLCRLQTERESRALDEQNDLTAMCVSVTKHCIHHRFPSVMKKKELGIRRGPYNLQMWASWQEAKWGDHSWAPVGTPEWLYGNGSPSTAFIRQHCHPAECNDNTRRHL